MDGNQLSTTTASSGVWPTVNNTDTLKIGAQNYAGNAINTDIDEVKIYNYARTPAQIAWDYNHGAPLAWYRFDECSETAVNNAAPAAGIGADSGNDGTLIIGATGTNTTVGTCTTSGAWYDGATGKINSAMDFDGTDDYVGTSNNIFSQSTFTGGITMSAWVKPASISSSALMVSIEGVYYLAIDSTTSKLAFEVAGGSVSGDSTTIANAGTWVHVVGTYDGTNSRIYVNGVLENTYAQTRYDIDTLNRPTTIGQQSTGSYWFNGLIDDVRIYNYALTAKQVDSLYNNGTASFK